MLDAHELKLKNLNNSVKKNIAISDYNHLKQNYMLNNLRKIKESIIPIIVMVCVSAAVGALLGITSSITKPFIEQRNLSVSRNAHISVLPFADSFKEINIETLTKNESINKILSEQKEDGQRANELKRKIKGIYEAYKGQEMIGWVIDITSKGYGGDIYFTIGISKDLKISAVKPGQNTETPGLGSKVLSKAFVSKLEGLQIKQEDFKTVKSASASENEIQGVSGATITSKAVVQALNDAAKIVKALSDTPCQKEVN